MQNRQKQNPPAGGRSDKSGTTAWKIRIENEDLHLLKQIAEKIAEPDRGLIPKPTVTALIQKAIKNYIAEALRRYRGNLEGKQLLLVRTETKEQARAVAASGAGASLSAS